jgi:hypothetical protein
MHRFLRRASLVLLSVVCTIGTSSGGELEIYLNDDAARGRFGSAVGRTNLDFDVGALHHRDEGTLFHAGLYVAGFADQGASTLEVALGGRLLVAETEVEDGSALAVGGSIDYALPKIERLALGAFLFYAPSSTSFGDVDEMLDVGASVGYRVLESSTLFLTVTSVDVQFDSGAEVEVDRGIHVGFRTSF